MGNNRISIEGFVAKDPETRQAGNHTVTIVTVPIEKGRRKDGQWVPDLDKDGNKTVVWWEGEFWNEHGAQVAQEIQKGYLVKLDGEPWPRPYVKNDGTPGLAATITNPTVSIVVRRPSRQQGQAWFGSGTSQQPPGSVGNGGMDQWAQPGANGPQNPDAFANSGTFGGGFDDEQPF